MDHDHIGELICGAPSLERRLPRPEHLRLDLDVRIGFRELGEQRIVLRRQLAAKVHQRNGDRFALLTSGGKRPRRANAEHQNQNHDSFHLYLLLGELESVRDNASIHDSIPCGPPFSERQDPPCVSRSPVTPASTRGSSLPALRVSRRSLRRVGCSDSPAGPCCSP